MKNITITVDEQIIELAKRSPEVRKSSLSAYVAKLLKRNLDKSAQQRHDKLMASISAAAETATSTWEWNRDAIYER